MILFFTFEGGPLITRGPDEENYELIGVTSWGEKCALADYPGVYARVTKQLDWISEITGGLQETCPRQSSSMPRSKL